MFKLRRRVCPEIRLFTDLKDKHEGEKFTCTCCNKTFQFHRTLKIHMMKQQAKKSGVPLLVECKICEKQFNIVYIHNHIKRAHTAPAENVSCQVCGKVVSGCNLQQHMLLHKEATFQCKQCPKKFPTQGKLNRHFNFVHEKIRSVFCPVCGKGYAQLNSLNYHSKRCSSTRTQPNA